MPLEAHYVREYDLGNHYKRDRGTCRKVTGARQNKTRLSTARRKVFISYQSEGAGRLLRRDSPRCLGTQQTSRKIDN